MLSTCPLYNSACFLRPRARKFGGFVRVSVFLSGGAWRELVFSVGDWDKSAVGGNCVVVRLELSFTACSFSFLSFS